MILLPALLLLNVVHSLPSAGSHECRIKRELKTEVGARVIEVVCQEDMLVSLYLEDGDEFSKLQVRGDKEGKIREFLAVEYYKPTSDMYIILDGEQYSVKDGNKTGEAVKLKQLLDDPEFRFFPTAVRLIHDEMGLRGWESPAVMFLYRLGMAAESYHLQLAERGFSFSFSTKKKPDVDPFSFSFSTKKKPDVDPKVYLYHGINPTEKCKLNGWHKMDAAKLIEDNCRGVCGQVCSNCWTWVCGDCCLHPGCLRHDKFCDNGYFEPDCLSCRGVLWDTITDTPLDC